MRLHALLALGIGFVFTGAWRHVDHPVIVALTLAAFVVATHWASRARGPVTPLGPTILLPVVVWVLGKIVPVLAWAVIGAAVAAVAVAELRASLPAKRSRARRDLSEQHAQRGRRILGRSMLAAFVGAVLCMAGWVNAMQIGFILLLVALAFKDVDGWSRLSQSWKQRRLRRRRRGWVRPLRVPLRRVGPRQRAASPGPVRTRRASRHPTEGSLAGGCMLVAVMTTYFLAFFGGSALDPLQRLSDYELLHALLTAAGIALLVFGPRLVRHLRANTARLTTVPAPSSAWHGRLVQIATVIVLLFVAGTAAAGIWRESTRPAPPPASDAHHWSGEGRAVYEERVRQDRIDVLRAIAFGRTDLVLRDEHLTWSAGRGRALSLVSIQWHDLAIRTPQGDLRLDKALLRQNQSGPPPALLQLVAWLDTNSIHAGRYRATSTDLLGPCLRGDHSIVLPEGELTRRVGEEFGEGHIEQRLLHDLDKAAAAFVRGLTDTPLAPASRRAAREVLRGVRPGIRVNGWAGLDPAIARRLIRHGWLDSFFADPPLVEALRNAVFATETLRPYKIWRGPAGHLVEYRDLFDRRVTVVHTRERSAYTRRQPAPTWHHEPAIRALVARFAATTDPLDPAATPVRLEVYSLRERLALWTEATGLTPGPAPWPIFVAPDSAMPGAGQTHLFLPIHILQTDLHGDVLALHTQHGSLRPAADGSDESLRRFREEAATALPDGAHLALLGELLFDYAWDGAEPGNPHLVGTRRHGGDWNQGPAATLATTAGGRMRGDCDDLAILYQDLVKARGGIAHVLDFPGHVGCGFGTWVAPNRWRLHLLHTGAPRIYEGATPTAVLSAAYEDFRAVEVLDADALPIAVHLAGETGLRYVDVPTRAFTDRACADACTTVHVDESACTYARAIETLEGLRVPGPAGAANTVRLGRMLRLAGEIKRARATLGEALMLAPTEATRMAASRELLRLALAHGSDEQVSRRAFDLIERDIPAYERWRGATVIGPWVHAAEALAARPALRRHALGVLDAELIPRLDPSSANMPRLLGQRLVTPHWLHRTANPLSSQLRGYYLRVAFLALRGDAALRATPAWKRVDTYVRDHLLRAAFAHLPTAEAPLDVLAQLAAYHGAQLGPSVLEGWLQDADQLAATEFPIPASIQGTQPTAFHLTCFRSSSAYWSSVCDRHLAAAAGTADLLALEIAAVMQYDAALRTEQLGRAHWRERSRGLLGRLTAAILQGDDRVFGLTMQRIADRRDQRLDRKVAVLLGLIAPHVEQKRHARQLAMWTAALGHARDGYVIAWHADQAGAHAHAQRAARLATNRHPERPAFIAELKRYVK